ncbi:MAG: MFS transporter [Dehalococcoidia bacterium]|jgi:MFS family permease|nr:MFS transporter [Dehalococcoidia bacterium]MDP6227914.1 MFS transporter [Dehalococcoidia bacterium]MDP7084990.1 MFS transporter [Dehalococcoidia bacterium]MDP7199670.1 MFS transporter [Dehalococcoidia bacterium]MDP7511391.1 MFS transporter [Dehalococcoidia bacterium]
MRLAYRLKDKLPFYYGWVVAAASGTAVFARMAPAITTLTVFIYPMSQELGWTRTMISGAVSAGALASLLISPIIGWAIDRFGARPLLVISVMILGVSIASLAWATVPVTFYLAYGAARVVFHTSAPIGATTVVSQWFIKKRGRAIGIVFAGGAIGGLLFTMASALLIDNYGLKVAWITLGLIVLAVSLAPTLFLIVERPEDMGLSPDGEPRERPTRVLAGAATPEDHSWKLKDAMGTVPFWILFVMGFAIFFVNSGVNVHIGAFYRDQGLSSSMAATAISVSWIVAAAASVGWGWVLEKVEARFAYSAILLIQTVGMLYLLSVSSNGEAFVIAVMIGMVTGGSNVIPSFMYANFFGRTQLGRIRGVGEIGVLLGQSTGPLLAGIVFDLRESYSLIFIVFSAVSLACSMLVLVAKQRGSPE